MFDQVRLVEADDRRKAPFSASQVAIDEVRLEIRLDE